MKNLKSLLLGILATTAIYSCGDKDDAPAKNQAPSQPKLISPEQGAMEVNINPTFKWEKSVDPEKSVVSYEIYVSKDNSFSDENTIKAIDLQETSYAFSNKELEHSTKYYWKVVASDKDKAKSESEVHNFTTIDQNLKISLLEPQNNAALTSHETTLKWNVKRNTSFKKEVTYSVFLRNGSSEFSTPLKKGLTNTEVHLSDLKGNGKYYWAIKAMDGEEVVSESEIFVFTTPNTAPSAAEIKNNPKQTISEEKVNVVFEWKKSEDPDRLFEEGVLRDEKLTYDFYLSTNNTFTNEDLKAKGLTTLTHTETGLLPETNYWAKVVTKDESGGKTESAIFNFKTKKLPKLANLNITEGEWTDPRDKKEYKTVTINGTTWLAENFAYIPYVKAGDDKNKKICSVYGVENPSSEEELKNSENYKKYGVLYTAHALEDIVPDGWHVATDDEWKELEKLSGMEDGQINTTGYKNRGITMHTFIKEGQPYTAPAEEPSDELHISVIYGGYYKDASWNGGFRGEQEFTYIWTSTEQSSWRGSGNISRAFNKSRTAIARDVSTKNYRMYVRLVQDKK